MSKRDRTTLKGFFQDGALPTATEYEDLIESCVNQIDDGYDKDDKLGLKLNSIGDSRTLMSFYRGLGASAPSWQISHGVEPGSLHFRAADGPDSIAIGSGADDDPEAGDEAEGAPKKEIPPGLTLNQGGLVGINNADPEWQLDVAGVARMQGRIGSPSDRAVTIPADGGWHDITRPMTGCQAIEVMAGAGGRVGDGRYGLLHAVAMNAYHPRNFILNFLFGRRRIRRQTAVYGSFADRLQLRWSDAPGTHMYKLQLRTSSSYGDGYTIRYYLTQLWFDPLMHGSRGDLPNEAEEEPS